MPHLSIEFSSGLKRDIDIGALCKVVHGAMLEAKIFPVAGIRVRAYEADHAIVADGLEENNFLAMTLSVGAGRPVEVLRAAGDLIFDAARRVLAGPLATSHFAVSLEIRVIDPALSWKDTPIHARLTVKS